MLLEADFASDILRIWNGFGDLTWNSQTWLGNGWFQGIEGGDETIQVEAVDMTVILSGVSSSIISLVLGDQKQGGAGRLYIGFLNASGAVVADPYLWWSGYYSHAEIAEAGEAATVRLYYESRLVDLERPKEGRWTHESQQDLFPGDKGFEYVIAAANWHGQWGGKKEKPKKDGKKKSGGNKGSPKRS
jgi:hypothetical protein